MWRRADLWGGMGGDLAPTFDDQRGTDMTHQHGPETFDTFCAKGADHHYDIGSFRLGRYGWFRWEATLHGSGAGNRRTPWGAMFGAWRFRREMDRNPHRYVR